MKIRSLKTYLNYALSLFLIVGFVFAIIVWIVYIVHGVSDKDIVICSCSLVGLILLGVLIELIPFIFSRRKYIFTDNYIEMYLNGKLLYKIKREQITEIKYYIIPWYSWGLIAILGLISFGAGMDDMCEILSIRFKEYEVYQKDYKDFFGKNFSTLKDEEESSGLYEIADNFSKLEVKRICKFLNIKPQIIR